ncbi:hypothetical protein B566_EDAN011543 [Ephemera danica]|nr:hypothetical protein B566_EDAN011543 [Ephemera danica]
MGAQRVQDDLDEEEYEETKSETIEQLKEFNDSLSKMMSGNMTLVDKFGSIQLSIQAAISAAFQTPAVIRAFIKKEPEQLRQRLAQLERDIRLAKVDQNEGSKQKIEILKALQQLGESLTPSEKQALGSACVDSANFVQVSAQHGVCEQALALAGSQLRSMKPT